MNFLYSLFNGGSEMQNRKSLRNLDVAEKSTLETPRPPEIKRYDMVMIYKAKNLDRRLETYMRNLEIAGLEVEQEESIVYPEMQAVLISAPEKALIHYSKLYAYELTKDNPNFVWVEIETCSPWRTQLTHPSMETSELMKRAHESVTRLRPTTFTIAERIMIVNRVMINNQYYDDLGNVYYSYESLKKLVEVYALHDSTWRWSRMGQLKDRQLLYHYWANLGCLLKVQPIFMIEKYFGTETAFYFLFFGFLNKMLLILAFIGIFAFLLGLLELLTPERNEFCGLDLPVCPVCQDFNICPIDSLKQYCTSKTFAMLFDNTGSVVFAFITSIWSIVFLIMWRRKQATMSLRWNVRRMLYDETLRPEFVENATVLKISRFTQKQIIDIPRSLKIRGYVTSYISLILLLTCSILLIFLTAFYKKVVHTLKSNEPSRTEMSITISASYIYYGVVKFILVPFVHKLAIVLTVLECHRTQQGYDCAIIYKECLLSVPSFYGIMIYLSLFKGKFFVYPTDATYWTVAGGIPADTCNPAGCMIDVTVQFIVIMTSDMIAAIWGSIYVMYIEYYVKFHVLKFFKKMKNYGQARRWEKDFIKMPAGRGAYVAKYKGMMITYGLITWFAAVCPLAPIFATLKHLVDLRLQAFEALILKRREIGVKIADIGCWNNVLIIVTVFGIVSNGVTIAFSSTFIHRLIYVIFNDFSLKGYVEKSFSSFDTKKFSKISGVVLPTSRNISDVCYYRGYQFEPENKEKFAETNLYWVHLIAQVLFFLLYENCMFIIAGLVFLIVPSIPHDVRLKYRDEEDVIREKRIELLNNSYFKQNRRQSPNR